MNQKAPVIYTIRKAAGDDVFYEFVPVMENSQVKDISVKVYEVLATSKPEIIASMEVKGTFYVVDPENSKDRATIQMISMKRDLSWLPHTITGTGVQTNSQKLGNHPLTSHFWTRPNL